MVRYAVRIVQPSSFKQWSKKFAGGNAAEKLRVKYDYKYIAACDDTSAENAIRVKFEGHGAFDERLLSLEFKRVGERQWLAGPFNAKVASDVYYPTFGELNDWEDRQLLLFPVEKKIFTLRLTAIDESGWKYVPGYIRFRAFSLQDARSRVRRVYSGTNLKNNASDGSPDSLSIASLEIKSVDRKWLTVFDSGTPERPAGQASANEFGTPERGLSFYFLGVLDKWGRRIRREEECFPMLRRNLWDLTDGLENTCTT